MSRRQLEAVKPTSHGRTLMRQNNAPTAETAGMSQPSPLLRSWSGAGSAPSPEALAGALFDASGGRLARAGATLVQLQRAYGNRYVQRVIAQLPSALVIQPKLVLGVADDPYEREADRVARQVTGKTRGYGPATSPQAGDEGEGRLTTQRPNIQRTGRATGGRVDAAAQRATGGACRGGHALPERVRGAMQQALGADFSEVRLHTDVRADQLNRALQARAFTTGQDIFFRRGEYDPDSSRGQHVLAHELTHVVQQTPALAQASAHDRKQWHTPRNGARLHDQVIQRMTIAFELSKDDTYVLGQLEQVLGYQNFVNEKYKTNAKIIPHRKNKSYRPGRFDKPYLGGLGPDETLNLVGHGSFRQTIGGYTPIKMFKLLKRLGLPKNQKGVIDLHGCLPACKTDQDGQQVQSYVEQLEALLTDYEFTVRGYEWCIHPGVAYNDLQPLEVSPTIYGKQWKAFEEAYNARRSEPGADAKAKQIYDELLAEGLIRPAQLVGTGAIVETGDSDE